MPLRSKKRKKSKQQHRPTENVAALYVEDIGTEGLKTSGMAPQLDIRNFRLKVDKKEKNKRKRRMERFQEQNEKLGNKSHIDEEDALNSALQSSRTSQAKVLQSNSYTSDDNKVALVGTSTALEKAYMRLTTYPKAEDVRPLKVLKKSLVHIKTKFIKEEDFDWANEQLKSVRQDITVQHLRCPFVLEVYETHARILLEHGDLGEFNQCQTMIRSLTHRKYDLDNTVIGNAAKNSMALQQQEEAADEFQAYRLLYDLVQHSWSDLSIALSEYNTYRDASYHCANGENHSELPMVARGLSTRHALNVVKAVMHNDYQTFFRLYESAPHLSAYLMDFLVRRVRSSAFERLIAAYRPTISVEFFREALVFHDLEETRRFLKKSGTIFVEDKTGPPFWVDCKATFATLRGELS